MTVTYRISRKKEDRQSMIVHYMNRLRDRQDKRKEDSIRITYRQWFPLPTHRFNI